MKTIKYAVTLVLLLSSLHAAPAWTPVFEKTGTVGGLFYDVIGQILWEEGSSGPWEFRGVWLTTGSLGGGYDDTSFDMYVNGSFASQYINPHGAASGTNWTTGGGGALSAGAVYDIRIYFHDGSGWHEQNPGGYTVPVGGYVPAVGGGGGSSPPTTGTPVVAPGDANWSNAGSTVNGAMMREGNERIEMELATLRAVIIYASEHPAGPDAGVMMAMFLKGACWVAPLAVAGLIFAFVRKGAGGKASP